jgi:hypothetical protein
MKQSDLEFLLKLQDTITSDYKRLLQDYEQKKQDLITKRDAMNNSFLAEKPDIQAPHYTRFRAMENIRLNQEIAKIDKAIEVTKENIRESVKDDKKYTLLKDSLIAAEKKKKEQFYEQQSDEYTIYKYSR